MSVIVLDWTRQLLTRADKYLQALTGGKKGKGQSQIITK